jgi:protein-S-isoprenylcysteine O-methyltransferase Ste14
MKTTFSVIIRVFLWLILLIGGANYSLIKDWNTVLFNSISFHIISAIIGFLILVLAFRAAGNGGKELAKGRVGDIPRLETNKLITTGIYSCMRHPMLFGLTLLPLGWALLLGSPTFIIIIAPIEIIFIIMMVIIFEEMEVKKKFGEAYKNYSKKVPMISFKKHCLLALFKKR